MFRVTMKRLGMLLVATTLAVSGFSLQAPATAIAQPESERWTIVLKEGAGTGPVLAAIEQAGATVVQQVEAIGAIEVETANPGTLLEQLLGHETVDTLSPSQPITLDEQPSLAGELTATGSPVPQDPAAFQWNIQRLTNNGAAWQVHAGTHDVVVGIIDSGIDLAHPDLAGNIISATSLYPGISSPWDQLGHGTHVAGIVAANGFIKGVAPGVGIRSYRVYGTTGTTSETTIANAIVAAANDGVDVINLSVAHFEVHGQYFYVDPVTGKRTPLGNEMASLKAYKRAVDYARRKNVVVVAAAGNFQLDLGRKQETTTFYETYRLPPNIEVAGQAILAPAQFPGVVTVSAIGGGFGTPDRLANYSNYGKVDVAAPGGDFGIDPNAPILSYEVLRHTILSTYAHYLNCGVEREVLGHCYYALYMGSSMATPHAAGVAALIVSQEYAETGKKPEAAHVVQRLQQSAEDIGEAGKDSLFGYGLVNAYNALTQR